MDDPEVNEVASEMIKHTVGISEEVFVGEFG
jgi:hypothetical protein